MCYNCGCGDPHDDMGHTESITEETIKKAAAAFEMPVEDAKKEMLKMLTDQLAQKK